MIKILLATLVLLTSITTSTYGTQWTITVHNETADPIRISFTDSINWPAFPRPGVGFTSQIIQPDKWEKWSTNTPDGTINSVTRMAVGLDTGGFSDLAAQLKQIGKSISPAIFSATRNRPGFTFDVDIHETVINTPFKEILAEVFMRITIKQDEFRWSSDKPIKYFDCIQINEPAEPPQDTWDDNFLCSKYDNLGWKWSYYKKIDGMTCSNWDALPDNSAWSDNYLCLPNDSPWVFDWSASGNTSLTNNLHTYEPAAPASDSWGNNYFGWQSKGSPWK